MTSIRNLINRNGAPFDSSELQSIVEKLEELDDSERRVYRDENASAIADNEATSILIISGPGTGKSFLFLDRINYWYQNNSQAKVVVTSFVRKLVADLQNEINESDKLSGEQKANITVSTLHKFARSIVEKNHGTLEWPLQPHIRIIGPFWQEEVWNDVTAFYTVLDGNDFTLEKFEQQWYNAKFEQSDEWKNRKVTYLRLCKFYNAVGFADLIQRASQALTENPDLNNDTYFIIDEYQDFNLAEESFIQQLVGTPRGMLVVGDDEQVLYEEWRAGTPELIRNLYQNKDYANGMLPFCGRSNFHITKTADYFIRMYRETENVEKIYLPLTRDQKVQKVELIACAKPSTAVDYIENFIKENEAAINERNEKLKNGSDTESFLLILSPDPNVKYYRDSSDKIFQIISEYQLTTHSYSEDYYKLLSYYSLAENSDNNFTFRKVLYHEKHSEDVVHNLINIALGDRINFCEMENTDIKDILAKCNSIKKIVDEEISIDAKIEKLAKQIAISDIELLKKDMERQVIGQNKIGKMGHEDEEEADLEELQQKKMNAIELLSFMRAKGLSADHVIIIGFDDRNMDWVSKNAFYVAMTRARKSLQIITALQSGGATQASKFLNHLPDDHVEYYSYRKSDGIKTDRKGKNGYKKYLETLNYHSKHK